MAVKAKIKNPPDKKDPPKREPIVVSDINDPRLKAYQDSLNLYNLNRNYINANNKQVLIGTKALKTPNLTQEQYGNLIIPSLEKAISAFEKFVDYKRISNIPNEPSELVERLQHAGDIGNYNIVKTKTKAYKKPVQPVIFKAKEKEKIEKIEPTAKKITFEKSGITPKKEPSKIKDKELIYRVEYYDPEKKQMTHQMFASEKEGSMFQKGLSSVNQLYGTKGYYVKSPSK